MVVTNKPIRRKGLTPDAELKSVLGGNAAQLGTVTPANGRNNAQKDPTMLGQNNPGGFAGRDKWMPNIRPQGSRPGNTGTQPTQTSPQYQSIYSQQINDLVNKAINREPFSYDPATDPAYQSYARQYLRMGDEAGRDTLADVAAATGGLPSSYAVTAAQQARNNYNQALTDKIPALMQAAYDKYRGEYQDALQGIGALQGLDDSAYNRFNTDRNYERGVFESDRDYNERVRQYNQDYAMEQKKFEESVRQYNQNYDLDKHSAEFERMLNTWNTLGYATKEIAKYFGIPEGTKTDDAAYRAAQLALAQAKSGGSGGGGGGRRSGGGGGGGDDTRSAQSIAGEAVARVANTATNNAAAIVGGTDNAKQYLARLGQYLAQGGTTGDKQALAIQKVQNDSSLSAAEKIWILQQLSK